MKASKGFTPKATRTTVLLCLLLVIALGTSLLFGGSTLEDAFITFRYARNLADGAGVGVWNVGQPPVEGATSFLWMLILGIGMKVGISPFLLSKVIGLGSLLGVILLFGFLSRSAARRNDERTSRAALATAVLAALYVPLAWYSVSGMETTFFSFLVAVVVVSMIERRGTLVWVLIDSVAIVVLLLLRPEGMVFGLLLGLFKIFFSDDRDRARFVPLAVFILAVIGIEVFRLVQFGELLPNTYYAKASGGAAGFFFTFGVSYLRDFLRNCWPIWLALAAGGVLALRRRDWTAPEVMLTLVVVIYIGYVLKVGGDPVSAFPLWRHFVHIAPVWLFLTGAAISRLSAGDVRAVMLAAAVGLLTVAMTWMKTFTPAGSLAVQPGLAVRQADNAYFDFVNRFADNKQVAAVSLAGQWGWYVPIATIDMLGLNDRHVAQFGTFQRDGALDSKTDMAYVMGQKPTIVDGHDSGLKLRQGRCPQNIILGRNGVRHDMLLGIFKSDDFLDNYYFVANAPYEVLDRALFVSASVADAARATGAELVPLRKTVLNDRTCLP
ncbi:hypothetical protein [Mycolicibacterium helvum]|uniref:Glycosyltransferase RgtA/B/C/D-like domain-containing protein n=1 Tax=Mycolicibacterium helvum TaxID=1534349 RepID=A0A7I7TBM0_9MYCO|nr:hypothetical protein [Mycolicibacterium helvum]BBY66370.1 hypothetical protein MHEL_46130 [Mycolicibacterium helvum]